MDYIHSIEDLDAFVNEEMLSIVYVSRPAAPFVMVFCLKWRICWLITPRSKPDM